MRLSSGRALRLGITKNFVIAGAYMDEKLSRTSARQPAHKRALMLEKMRASRSADAPCFTYLFVLKEVAAIKVGISIDPLTRLNDLPQLHLRTQDVFDLRRSIVVFAQRRSDAMQLERAALKHHARWRVDAPSSAVVYCDGVPTCVAPVRWSAGGKNEWLDSSVYSEVLNYLLFADSSVPRPSISVADLADGVQGRTLQ